ncbi:MAG: NAD(P)H-binding protein [Polyangiaceae bacterium]
MIILFGSTGNIGPHLLDCLRERGAIGRTRAVVRSAEAARAKLGARLDGVDVVEGDIEKHDSLARALDGGTVVYSGVGGATGTPDLVTHTQHLIDASARAGVRRYVHVSGMDAGPDAPSRIQKWHGAIEAHLRASSLAPTVMRPTFFFQNFFGLVPAIKTGALPFPTGEGKCALIDARDIAACAAAVLAGEGHEGKTYTITGPKALSHGEAAQIFTRVLERQVNFADLPGPAFEGALVQAGLPAWFAALLTDVYVTLFATSGAARVTSDVETLTGKAPRALETFVRDHRAVFA